MAKKYRTGIIIEGDAKGGVRAIQATDRQLEKLDRQSRRNAKSARIMKKAYASSRAAARRVGLAATAAGAGLAAMVVSQTDAFRETQSLAKTLDISVGKLQAYQYAAEQVGVSGDKMADILKDTSDKIGDAYANQGGEAYQVLQNLNLSAEKLIDLSPDEQLLAIADALQGMPKAVQVNALESLGDDASRLLPLLKDGGRELQRATEKARKFNYALNETDASKMAQATDQMQELRGVAKGLAQEITIGATPAISDLTDTLTDPDVQRGLSTFVNGFIKAVDWVSQATAAFANFTSEIGRHAREMTETSSDIVSAPIKKTEKRIEELQQQLKATRNLGLSGGVIGAPNAGLARDPDEIRKELAEQKKILADYKAQKKYFDDLYSGQSSPTISRYIVPHPRRTWTPDSGGGGSDKESPADRYAKWQADQIRRSAGIFQDSLDRLESNQEDALDRVRQDLMTPDERRNQTLNQRLGSLQTAKDRGLIGEQERLKLTGRAWKDYAQSVQGATEQASVFSNRAAENIQDELGDTLEQVLTGHFDGILGSWVDTLQSMASEALAANLGNKIFGKSFSKTGEIGGWAGSAIDAARGVFGGGSSGGESKSSGGSWESGAVSAFGSVLGGLFANGGVSDKPAIFGESGPEAAVPLPDGRRIPVDLNGGTGGGDVNVRVNVINQGGQQLESQGQRTRRGPDGTVEVDAIVKSSLGRMAGSGELDPILAPYSQRQGQI